jgi:hypothetical protein
VAVGADAAGAAADDADLAEAAALGPAGAWPQPLSPQQTTRSSSRPHDAPNTRDPQQEAVDITAELVLKAAVQLPSSPRAGPRPPAARCRPARSRFEKRASSRGGGNRARARPIQTPEVKTWARAFAAALVAHAALLALLWRHGGARRDPPGTSGVIEMAIEMGAPGPAPLDDALPARPSPSRAKTPQPRALRIPAPALAAPAEPRRAARAAREAEADVSASSNIAAPAPAAPARAEPLAARPTATAPAAAAPPARVNLDLKRDLAAELFPSDVTVPGEGAGASAAARPGQTVETETLRGRVGRDGSMKIRSKSPVAVGSNLASPGDLLRGWMKNPKEHAAERDGTAQLFRGKFDTTDAIMRLAGQDPYRAERMKMLDATRDQRIALAASEQATRRRDALVRLPGTLRAIWADTSHTVRERRRLIFSLWDECEEPTEGDAAGSSAGARARALILAFVREEAPAGTPLGYSPDEMAQLNAGRDSRQRFDPYGRTAID